MSPSQFAAEIGLSSPILSHILKGRNNPSLDVMEKILLQFKFINPDWLILGQGPVEREKSDSHEPTLFDSELTTDYKSMRNANQNAPINHIENPSEKVKPEYSALHPQTLSSPDDYLQSAKQPTVTGPTGRVVQKPELHTDVLEHDTFNHQDCQNETHMQNQSAHTDKTAKSVVRIVCFYSDNTYEEFLPQL